MKVYKNGCPICSGACRLIGTCDHGREVEIACANCTVYRISLQAVKSFQTSVEESRNLYSLLARRHPDDHMIVLGASSTEITYGYASFKQLKAAKVHIW
jgi:hypothetical protein